MAPRAQQIKTTTRLALRMVRLNCCWSIGRLRDTTLGTHSNPLWTLTNVAMHYFKRRFLSKSCRSFWRFFLQKLHENFVGDAWISLGGLSIVNWSRRMVHEWNGRTCVRSLRRFSLDWGCDVKLKTSIAQRQTWSNAALVDGWCERCWCVPLVLKRFLVNGVLEQRMSCVFSLLRGNCEWNETISPGKHFENSVLFIFERSTCWWPSRRQLLSTHRDV